MRSPEELAELAEGVADRIADVADNARANAAAQSAVNALDGESLATAMLAAAYLLRHLADESEDRVGFMATITRLVAGSERAEGAVH